jgi:hypothetical protein
MLKNSTIQSLVVPSVNRELFRHFSLKSHFFMNDPPPANQFEGQQFQPTAKASLA